MTIGLITAMNSEYTEIAKLLSGTETHTIGRYTYTEGNIGGNKIILTLSGIGKVNAALGAESLIRNFTPHCVISTGVAGGIDSCLGVMDVVVSSRVVYHDVWCGEGNDYGQVQGLPTYYEGNTTLLNTALSLKASTKVIGGLICTGDQFITNREELDLIKSNFAEGLAVDMESTAIAQTCYLHSTPFISFRIISDTPSKDKHQEQYENFWGTLADKSFGITLAFLQALPNTL